MKPEEIISQLSANMEKLNRYGIEKIGLFGSGARNTLTSSSDLDFLVEFYSGMKSFDNYMDVKFFLEDLFHRNIDLVIYQNIKEPLKEDILKEVIYAA